MKARLLVEFKPGTWVLGVIAFQDKDQHVHQNDKGLCVHEAKVQHVVVFLIPMVNLHLVVYHHETQKQLPVPDLGAMLQQAAQAFGTGFAERGGFPPASTLN